MPWSGRRVAQEQAQSDPEKIAALSIDTMILRMFNDSFLPASSAEQLLLRRRLIGQNGAVRLGHPRDDAR